MNSAEQLLGRTLVLVAHPDDECIAFGALMQRMRDPLVVYATDGAPVDPFFWRPYGSRAAYAGLRRREARAALGAAGVRRVEFLAEGPGCAETFVDQRLYLALDAAFERLQRIAAALKPEAIATLAYEGGHPDHDACNVLGKALARSVGVPAWEAPLYHRDPRDESRLVLQRFACESGSERTVRPAETELERKRRMAGAYSSQGDFLKTFALEREVVRPMAEYDYSRPPHDGRLNYEVWQWAMTGAEVCERLADFVRRQPSKAGTGQATGHSGIGFS